MLCLETGGRRGCREISQAEKGNLEEFSSCVWSVGGLGAVSNMCLQFRHGIEPVEFVRDEPHHFTSFSVLATGCYLLLLFLVKLQIWFYFL